MIEEYERLDRCATTEQLHERQCESLARVLRAAYQTPFYQAHWTGVDPRDGDPLERLTELPLVEKRHLQDQRTRMLSGFPGRTTVKRTGGSTAEPVAVVKNASGLSVERAVSWLGYGWVGIHPGSKVARFWGTPLTRAGRFRFRLADLAMRRIRFSAFDIDAADMQRYWSRCKRFRPDWLYGYTSLLHLFAEFLDENGIDGGSLGLKAVVCTSEPLDDGQKADIERVFRVPVQNEYGCGETGAIAYSCEKGPLHIMSESVLVEVLDEEGRHVGPGETGEVVVTDLANVAMPLIRYRLRDRAVLGPRECSCGRPWPSLESVLGRTYDVVYTPEGRRWHGEKIKYLLVDLHEAIGGFRQFQVVQLTQDELEVRLVTDSPIAAEVEARIRLYVSERLDGMRARVRRVPRIERAASGKIRIVKNEWLESRERPIS